MSGKIGYFGPRGTYTFDAANCYNKKGYELVPYPTIIDVFRAVDQGIVEEGIVPLENSIEGSINITLDLLAGNHSNKICAEVVLTVDHCLAVRPGTEKEDINCVFSHAQPLAQCRRYLEDNLPGVETKESRSTAEAAGIIAVSPEPWAAIVNKKAAGEHGLQILAEGIQDCRDNKTRFVVLAKEDAPWAPNSKTSVIVSITDRPGGLYQLLKEFALKNINLTKIESRPAKKSLGDYIFYIEMKGHRLDRDVQECLKSIESLAASLKILGSYPAAGLAAQNNENSKELYSLQHLREDVDIIDYQIIELLAQRTRLVNIIGERKKEIGYVKDTNREKEVLERVRKTAREKGFDPEVTEKVYSILFDHFVNLQKQKL